MQYKSNRYEENSFERERKRGGADFVGKLIITIKIAKVSNKNLKRRGQKL